MVLAFATLVGLYMAANIGANDLANAMGTSVGSGALTMNQAVVVSMIFNQIVRLHLLSNLLKSRNTGRVQHLFPSPLERF